MLTERYKEQAILPNWVENATKRMIEGMSSRDIKNQYKMFYNYIKKRKVHSPLKTDLVNKEIIDELNEYQVHMSTWNNTIPTDLPPQSVHPPCIGLLCL